MEIPIIIMRNMRVHPKSNKEEITMRTQLQIRSLLALLIGCLSVGLVACSETPTNAQARAEYPAIFPDYVGVTIPYNIAPLNFRLDFPAECCYVRVGDHSYSG